MTLLDLMKTRRSIRKYTKQKVEDEINEFLHQEITWEKVHDFLFQEVTFGKRK